MEKFFKLKEYNTNVSTEFLAGVTTFFTMAYIMFVNPPMLASTGIPLQAVFLATIISAGVTTIIMGLFANVPYALAPGMGLNAFFTYTVCFTLGFSWQEALAMVFVCGVIALIMTVTNVRKQLIAAIPESLKNAIGGGIGLFIAYIGLVNVGMIQFGAVPSIAVFNNPVLWLTIIGIVLTIVLMLLKVKGAILIGIIVSTLIGIPMGVVDLSGVSISLNSWSSSFQELGSVFGAAFGSAGLGSLLADSSRYPVIIITIFAFSLTDVFDTIGTFIGTGKKSGIFSIEEEKQLESGKGMKSRLEKALFVDFIGTMLGAVLGTSNVTTYVESSAGIAEGGRTGLTAVVVGVLFLLCSVLAPLAGVIPSAATAPALIIVGVLMTSAFADIKWPDFEEAVPAFFAAVFMVLSYSITTGIAVGFIFYCVVKLSLGKVKEIHPILAIATILFLINFITTAMGL